MRSSRVGFTEYVALDELDKLDPPPNNSDLILLHLPGDVMPSSMLKRIFQEVGLTVRILVFQSAHSSQFFKLAGDATRAHAVGWAHATWDHDAFLQEVGNHLECSSPDPGAVKRRFDIVD